MGIRVYVCPVVGSGTRADPFRSQALELGLNATSFMASKQDGTPAGERVLSVVRAEDFAVIEADPDCDDLFMGFVPGAVRGRADLLTLLGRRSWGDLSLVRRAAISSLLDEMDVPRWAFTQRTPLWRVMQATARSLLERDHNAPNMAEHLAHDEFGSAF